MIASNGERFYIISKVVSLSRSLSISVNGPESGSYLINQDVLTFVSSALSVKVTSSPRFGVKRESVVIETSRYDCCVCFLFSVSLSRCLRAEARTITR